MKSCEFHECRELKHSVTLGSLTDLLYNKNEICLLVLQVDGITRHVRGQGLNQKGKGNYYLK